MITDDIFCGELVRLSALDPEQLAGETSRWYRDSVFWRLMSSDAARVYSPKATQDWIEKELSSNAPGMHWFAIKTRAEDRLIGDVELSAIHNGHGDTYVGIAIGERDFWGKGYGTDAMRIITRYAFSELNVHRISLDVFEYNSRAIRSYEKAGFRLEGRARGFLNRDGRRWDLIYMGILRSEWEALQ